MSIQQLDQIFSSISANRLLVVPPKPAPTSKGFPEGAFHAYPPPEAYQKKSCKQMTLVIAGQLG